METLIKRHFWVVHLLGLGLVAWQLGGVITGFAGLELAARAAAEGGSLELSAAESDGSWQKRLNRSRAADGAGGAMAARSPFLIEEPVVEPEPEPEATDEAPAEQAEVTVDPTYEVTKLPLKLLGTMVVRPVDYSSATMEVNRQDQKLVTVGYELLEGQARVEEIHRTYVVLKESGKLTIAPLWPRAEGGAGGPQAADAGGAGRPTPGNPMGGTAAPNPTPGGANAVASRGGSAADPPGVKKVGDTTYQLERSMLNEKLKNLASLGQQTRVVPNYRGGKYDGFRMIGMASASLFRDIGFENGDIVKVINGNRIDSPNKALALYDALKNKSRLTVQIERGGMLKTLRYTVK